MPVGPRGALASAQRARICLGQKKRPVHRGLVNVQMVAEKVPQLVSQGLFKGSRFWVSGGGLPRGRL